MTADEITDHVERSGGAQQVALCITFASPALMMLAGFAGIANMAKTTGERYAVAA